MFTTTEDEPAILHAWCDAWFLGGWTEDDADALREHAADQLRAGGLQGEQLQDALDDIDIDYAPIPDLEAGDLCVDEEIYDTDADAEYLIATIFVKGHGAQGGHAPQRADLGHRSRHWAGSKLIDWFSARGAMSTGTAKLSSTPSPKQTRCSNDGCCTD